MVNYDGIFEQKIARAAQPTKLIMDISNATERPIVSRLTLFLCTCPPPKVTTS
jgi:hypothetical protein